MLPTPARHGSALLLCLALATFAAMVGYAFLRGATRQAMSSKSEMFIALARSAAQSGLAHATEQIALDYNADRLDVAVGAAGTQPAQPAPTHLDGPYRAPFVSRNKPNVLEYATDRIGEVGYSPDSLDVGEENDLLGTLASKLEGTAWHAQGFHIYDGRGRYVEVNYHNYTRPSPATAAKPVQETDFPVDNPPPPERSAAVFLDENLHRLSAGPVVERRRTARYRLRYAVGVEDLSGHLLTNPRAAMNTDWRDADNDYRTVPRWLDHAGHVLDNMMMTWEGSRAGQLRLGHVFRGRGNSGNVDRSWRTTDADWIARLGLPASFPLMFRAVQKPAISADRFLWFGNHCYDNDTGQANLGGRLYSFSNVPMPTLENIPANPAGGEILTPVYQSARKPYSHALVGPQYSWWNQIYAVQGNVMRDAADTADSANRDGGTSDPAWSSKWSYFNALFSLFGRRQTTISPWKPAAYRMDEWVERAGRYYRCTDPGASTTGPNGTGSAIVDNEAVWRYEGTEPRWYHGRVDTPFCVNLLTAPPQVVSQMILTYLPPHLKILHYTHKEFYRKIGVDAQGNTIYDPSEDLARRDYGPAGAGWDYAMPGFEILNDQVGPGFSEFPAPSSLHMATLIKPDYYQDPRDPRPVAQRYPGPLSRGDTATPGDVPKVDEGADDLGRHIDVDVAMGQGTPVGQCTHTLNPLLFFAGSDRISYYESAPNIWKVIQRIDTGKATYKYSYLWDLAFALTTTLSYARATWVQYPNYVFEPRDANPDRGFNPASLRDPLAYDTIEEIDALFLRQLGENLAAPGTPNPNFPVVSERDTTWPWTKYMYFRISSVPVSNTIGSLVANNLLVTAGGVSSVERAKVMERMINDFRMSFFGSSPKYRDFRPLDFYPDGQVQCSCYDANPAASHEEKLYRTNRWKAAEANGRGPAPSDLVEPFDPALASPPYNYPTPDLTLGKSPWFTVTGCFYIGKSHFYRVFTRGEVYDNLLRKPVAQQELEAVIAIDPECPESPPAGRIAPEFRTIFKQWRANNITSELPLQLR